MEEMQREICTLQTLVLHSKGISVLLDRLESPGGGVFLAVTYRLGFSCSVDKKAPVWGLEHKQVLWLTLEQVPYR